MHPLIERFREHIALSGRIGPGERVVVGYSGGADSTCLIHLCRSIGIEVAAAHLNHMQRNEAEMESDRCSAFATNLGCSFYAGAADVPLMSQELGIGLEEAGRNARYEFLEQIARLTKSAWILTGHTMTDQAETVLHHLARGCGLTGAAGIPEVRDNVFRPLLPFRRSETAEYCAHHGFAVVDDPANHDISFSRARVRHRILPEMEALNPRVEEALARFATIAATSDRFLNGMAAASLERAEQKLNGDLSFLTKDIEVALDRTQLEHLPDVLLHHALRLAVGAIGGRLDSAQTELALKGESGSVTVDGGEIVLEWTPSLLHVRRLEHVPPYRIVLDVPGALERPDLGWRLQARHFTTDRLEEGSLHRASLVARINPRGFHGALFVREIKSGDEIQPIGFSGSRKLGKLLGEAHLTPAARGRLPVICDLVGPIWIPGVCLSERVRPSSDPSIEIRFHEL